MHPQILRAFQDEMRKMAAESVPDEEAKQIKSKRRAAVRAQTEMEGNERAARATMGALGANFGAGIVTMALMKGPSQPNDAGAMQAYVKDMAKKMKLPGKVTASTPGNMEQHGWAPFYNPQNKSVNVPLHTRDSIIAHELGHAKNDMLLDKASPIMRAAWQGLQTISRVGSGVTLIPATIAASKNKDKSYTAGIIQAVISSPMVAEEAAASTRATAHLIRQHGVGKGLWKSLPLVPAFATYAAIAGAPLLVTYLRRRAAEKQGKEKKSAALASGLGVSYSSR